MKSKLLIIIFLLATTVLSGCSSSYKEERVLSDAQWLEDIDELDNKLRDYHSDLFRFVSEDEYEKSIEELKLNVKDLSDTDVKLRMAQIISSVGDSHTSMLPSELLSTVPSKIEKGEKNPDMSNVIQFPVKCEFFDDGLRVVECDSKYKEILGYKLVSINNIDVNKILNEISTLVGYDYGNGQKGLEWGKNFLNVYDILNFFDIVDSDKAEYVFENDKNDKVKLSLKATADKNIDYISADRKEMKHTIMPEGESKYYWYKGTEKDDILYFKFNSFISDTTGEKYPNFNDFLERLLGEINSKKYRKLVIDVRDNGGGRMTVLNALEENIKYGTNLSGEDIYIITGKRSGSASVILSYNMQSKMGATVVGEETGGNVNLFSSGSQIELPNSKLKPAISSQSITNKEGHAGGVKPNIEIKQNYEDYIKGIDTCYEYIKKSL